MSRQRGFTTFTVTLLLLLILLAVSLLVGKALVTDRRVAVNEVLYRQAMTLAEQGLADGLGRITMNSAWSGPLTVSSANGSYVLGTSSASITLGTRTYTPVTLSSSATLSNNQATAAVQVTVLRVSVLTNGPAAPLTVGGGTPIGGNYTVVANPNGGGPGVPVSVWSDKSVGGDGSWQTCNQQEYSAGNCGSNGLSSSKSGNNEDIKENDPAFPSDLVAYLFGENNNADGWAKIESKAVSKTSNCNGLNASSTGLYIVDGNCSVPSVVGTIAAPVILIVRDGDISINGGATFNGLLFSYSSNPATITPTVKLNGNAVFNGSLVSNYPLKPNGTFDMIYNQEVFDNMLNGTGPTFNTTKIVPGSWRDW